MWLDATYIDKNPIYFITAHKPLSKTRPRIANICYETKVKNLNFTPSDECVEIKFFDLEQAKKLNLIENMVEILKQIKI